LCLLSAVGSTARSRFRYVRVMGMAGRHLWVACERQPRGGSMTLPRFNVR
jgi:hypothetical protein